MQASPPQRALNLSFCLEGHLPVTDGARVPPAAIRSCAGHV